MIGLTGLGLAAALSLSSDMQSCGGYQVSACGCACGGGYRIPYQPPTYSYRRPAWHPRAPRYVETPYYPPQYPPAPYYPPTPPPPAYYPQPEYHVRGRPAYAPGGVVYIDGPPVYIDAPPVYVEPAQVYVERPQVIVNPSEVIVAPPEVHFDECVEGAVCAVPPPETPAY